MYMYIHVYDVNTARMCQLGCVYTHVHLCMYIHVCRVATKY